MKALYQLYNAQLLAGMHRPGEEYCITAVKVLDDVRASYANDAVIMSIVEDSEAICASFGYH